MAVLDKLMPLHHRRKVYQRDSCALGSTWFNWSATTYGWPLLLSPPSSLGMIGRFLPKTKDRLLGASSFFFLW